MEILILIVAVVGVGTYAAYRHHIERPLRELEGDARDWARAVTGHAHPWPCKVCKRAEQDYITNALSTFPLTLDAPDEERAA
jgi:hypothetical protein